MYQFGIKVKRLLLVAGDFAVFAVALLLTLLLRYGSLDQANIENHIVPFTILGVVWLVCFYIVGLYNLSLTRDTLSFFRTFLEGMLFNLALALGFFYLFPFFGIAPRTNLILDFVLILLLGYIWRLVFNKLIAPSLFRNRILFVGSANDAQRLDMLLGASALGFELVAVAETAPGTRFDDGRVSWHVSVDLIDQILKDRSIHTIVLGHRPEDIPGLRDSLYKTLFTPVSLVDRATLEETITGRVPLEYVSQTWFLEHLRENEKAWYDAFKRFVDLILSLPIGLFTVVVFPFVALAIKATSKGPIFYSQMRVGKHGKLFRIWKFRTMRADAESSGQPQFATRNDPRITVVGKFLRSTRVDELPQIWNVLRGDLSLIGPRPERPEFVEELTRQMPYYSLRHLTRPGLTGWAQVNFPYASTFEENLKKLQFDLYYIKNRSPLLDVAILLKTIGIVLRRKGT
ncbi:sugar transferase [Candidatus Uhrbacteria bacterium]|nr:sugar transferase [Candidatus Uhrbacteria bacterium]